MLSVENLETINRGVIVVIPKMPFYDWVNKLDPENPVNPSDFEEHNSYLVRDNIDDLEKLIKKYYKIIFENECFGMWTDPDDWPEKMTLNLFQKWFDYHISSVVYDLEVG